MPENRAFVRKKKKCKLTRTRFGHSAGTIALLVEFSDVYKSLVRAVRAYAQGPQQHRPLKGPLILRGLAEKIII